MYMRKNFLIAATLSLVVSALLGNYCFASAAEPSRKVTITPQNVSLNEIISQIEEQTGFLFITKEDVDLSARVTVSGSEMYVREIMEQVANETPVNYHIQSHYIVLSKKQTMPKSSTQEESVLKGKVTDERDPEAFDLQTIAGAMEYIISYAKSTWNCPVLFYSGTPVEDFRATVAYERYPAAYLSPTSFTRFRFGYGGGVPEEGSRCYILSPWTDGSVLEAAGFRAEEFGIYTLWTR